MQLTISYGDHLRKMAGVPSINSNPKSNEFCIKQHSNPNPAVVCTKCYAFRALETYRQSAVAAYERNSILLSSGIIPINELPFLNASFARFHSFGELINMYHLQNFINFSIKNSFVKFGLWTKRTDIIRKVSKFPKNMVLIYSNPWLDRPMNVPELYHKVFNVVTGDYIQKTGIKTNCHGKCIECRKCYLSNTKIIIEHGRTGVGAGKL